MRLLCHGGGLWKPEADCSTGRLAAAAYHELLAFGADNPLGNSPLQTQIPGKDGYL